ncbi:ankyrin repeat-containing domain protein [Xylaria intraflava]|nr:ankyrin repeat-containing domain protein [Xylaria intraflava]
MLSSLVIDHLRKVGYQRGAGLAYLYCNYKKYEEQRAIDFLSAILKQLVEGLPSVPDAVEALYYKHERLKSRPSFDDISVTIRSVCDCYPEVFIVIDALDECLDEHRNALLSKLKILQASNSNVRLMVTSRPIITIIQAFENAACLTIAAHEKDVKQFVEGQIPRLARCVSREPDLKQLVISSINNAADGMFLLARLLLDSLVDKTTPKAIKSALESLEKGPEALSQAYKGAIDRIENQAPGHHSLAKQVLSWISCARRPLSLKELQHALATEIGERQFDDENITDISDIVSVCAGLVTVDGQSDVVRLVHKTTQEYFDKMWTSIFPTAHEDIAMTCVSYLSFDAFETGACQDRMAFTARLESYALYDYAARNWGYHARTASIEKEELILDFLKSEAKVSASAELIISSEFLWSRFYSRVPSKITGMHLSAYFGLGDTMTALLEIGYSLCLQDTEGRNPLFYAAGNGQDGVIAQFLDTNYVHSGSQDKLGRTILFYAARYGREAVVKSLLTRDDIDINLRSYNGVSPLSYAAEHGHESVVKLLLAVDGVDPNSKDYRERTPLSCAAKNGHEAVVKLLLGNDGVDPNSRDLEGCTPLLYASWIHTATVRLLLGKDGVDPDPEDMNGQTPLSRAASFGLEEAVELFLATKGVNPNSRDKKGRTPLSHAAGNGKNGVVKLLLADGRVDPDSRDANGRTPLSYAAGNEHEFGQKEVVELLLAEARVDPDSKDADGRTPLSYAVRRRRHGAIEVIQVLLTEARIDPDSKDANGRTPLSHAAEMGRRRAVKMLLANERIDPNTKDVDGRTPLSHAMKRGDTHDRTPLSHAAEHGGTGSVKLLLAEGLIAPDSKDINGRTPLSYAAEMGRRETVRMLLADDRIDPDSKDANSYTPLSYAAEKGHIEVVKLLLQKTTFSKTLQMSGQTLFSWAAETWYNGIVRGLTVWDEIPVDLTSREIRKLSIAEENTLAAVRNWHEAVVRLLLASKRKAEKMKQQPDADMRCEMMVELFLASEGVNPDLRDAFGRTLLWWAARNGYEAVVRLLLAKEGVDPESRDDDGRTSLLYAAKNGHVAVVKLLAAKDGVDLDSRDAEGRTPLSWAAGNGHVAVVELLDAKHRINGCAKR